jgi:tetratricopeptide (TPR) repeat protein
MENMSDKAYDLAKYTHENFPDNPYFHRSLARSAFMIGKLDQAMELSKDILSKIDRHQIGYEATSGRYASYILGYYYLYVFKNPVDAKKYFNDCLSFSKQTDSMDSGYYWASVLGLARIAYQELNYDQAVDYCKEVLDKADRKSSQHTEAKKLLAEAKKARRKRK